MGFQTMIFKHSGVRIFLLTTDSFMNSWVEPLLWITGCFIVSQKKVNLFEIRVFRKFASLVECSHRREQTGVAGIEKSKKEGNVLILYSHTNKSNKTHPEDAWHEQFHKPGIDPQLLFKWGSFAVTPSLVHLLSMPSSKLCAKYRNSVEVRLRQ